MLKAVSLLKPSSASRPLNKITSTSRLLTRSNSTAMRLSNAELIKSVDQTPGELFKYQSQLPKLPVPKLSETLPKYLKTVEPLLSKEELAHTTKTVEEFAKSAQGQELQRRLEARAAEPGRVNWLEEWWNDLSYMGYRDPVTPYVSYFYAYKDDKLRRKATQRAAAIVRAAWQFRAQVESRTLAPEMARDTPFCSHSYNYMFNATRVPVRPSDVEAVFDLAANTHITVVRNNQFFALQLIHDGQLLSAAEIESQLDRIVEQADSSAAVPVGVLTADNRDLWADNYKLLLAASPKNAQTLETLQSSAFTVCLDDSRPVTREEYHRVYWHGNGRNRWFDKSLQFIVCDNGKAGSLAEHSSMDGTPTCRLSDYILDQTLNNKVDLGSSAVRPDLPAAEPLVFVTPPNVVRAIEEAAARFDKTVGDHQLKVLQYEGFGKDEIKKLGFSPDGFAQMMIQLGYYKLNGVCRATYEAAAT
ncbi:choline/Carnitine O-acyltransferase, partial [Linderina pennispora]